MANDIAKNLLFCEAEPRDPLAKYLLMTMALQADESGTLSPKISVLAKQTGLTERSIQNKIKLLKAMGFITVFYRNQASSLFVITWPYIVEGKSNG